MKTENFKSIAITMSILFAIVLATGIYMLVKKSDLVKTLETEKIALTETIQHRDSVVNDFVGAFNEIEDNLTFITARRNQLALAAENEMSKDKKRQIIQDIRLMDSMLVASSQHIEQLEKKVKDSGVRLKSFENRIAALNKTVADNSMEIEQLRLSVNEKDVQIAGLNTRLTEYEAAVYQKDSVIRINTETIRQNSETIQEKTEQLNTAWYTVGSWSELKEKGILSRTGGLLGIGSVKDIQPNLTPEGFTALNIREVQTIPLHTKKAKIISEHPENSYEMIYENGEIAALEIQNPDEFWRISKYAVIEVK